MGEIPSRPFFHVKLWFAVAVLASTTAGLCAVQAPAAQTTSSPPQNTSPTVRKTLALEEMPARLSEDHANARWMAEQIAGIGGCQIDLETVQTNIVIFRPESRTAAGVIAALKSRGILSGTAAPEEVRFVTHRDVDRAACERAVDALRAVLQTP